MMFALTSLGETKSEHVFISSRCIDALTLKIVDDFGTVSGKAISDVFIILRIALKHAGKSFDPFYGKDDSLSGLLRKGLLTETMQSPVVYRLSSSFAEREKEDMEARFSEACGDADEIVRRLLSQISSEGSDRDNYARKLAFVAVAHDKVPARLRLEFLRQSGFCHESAKRLTNVFQRYLLRIKKECRQDSC